MKYLFFIFFIPCYFLNGQMVLEYGYYYKKDTLDDNLYSENYFLVVSDPSKYFLAESEINLYNESTNKEEVFNPERTNTIQGDGINRKPSRLKSVFYEFDHEIVFFKNYLNKIKVKYTDSLNIKWKLQNDTITYNGYKCKIATTNYSGRFFTAYFTEDIPISQGPYVFNGLPGAIVYISDKNNNNFFELIRVSENKILFKLVDYIDVSKDEFEKIEYEWKTDPFRLLQPNNSMSSEQKQAIKRKLQEKLNNDNNSIELTNE